MKKIFFLRRSGGVREERTDHTKRFRRTLAGFGLTWGSETPLFNIDGKLTFRCTRNGPQNPPFCPGSLQDTFIIYSSILHQHNFQKCFAKRKISRIENLKIQKPRFANRSPVRSPYVRSLWKTVANVLCSCRRASGIHCVKPFVHVFRGWHVRPRFCFYRINKTSNLLICSFIH